MTYTVSITSQGQINIPIKVRRSLFAKTRKATLSVTNGTLLIEPINDFLAQGGALSTRKKSHPEEIRQAFEKHLADEAMS